MEVRGLSKGRTKPWTDQELQAAAARRPRRRGNVVMKRRAGLGFRQSRRDGSSTGSAMTSVRQKPVCDVDTGFAASLPCLLANVAIQQERTVKWDGNKAT